ncbi:MAG TPA: nucleotidyl transferase AbiEii/AbiGii toxin family protein [Gammaproteobacteria bacterium]
MHALPAGTERLLRAIDASRHAEGLILAGGTALALRIAHRLSADLDFVFPAERLPRKRVARLLDELGRSHSVEPFPNLAAEQEFLDSGLELVDYQQDYSIDRIKVSFFVPDPARLSEEIQAERSVAGLNRIAVATLRSLFLMKAVALNSRMTTRDLFDVYTLIEQHGCPEAELFEAADRFGYSPDVLKTRLLGAAPRRDDPGIELPAGAPPTFAQLKAYFADLVDRIEQAQAEAHVTKPRSKKKPRRRT